MFCEMRKRWMEFNVNNAFRKQYFSWREFEIEGEEIQFHDLINFIQIRRSKILVRLLFPQFVKINLQRYNIKSASSLEMIKYIINLALSRACKIIFPLTSNPILSSKFYQGKEIFDPMKINPQYKIYISIILEMIKYIINLALSTCMENNIPVDIQFLIQYLSKGGKIRFDQSKNSSHSKKKKMIENSKKISRRCYGEQKRPESNLDFCIIHRMERVPFVRLKSSPLPSPIFHPPRGLNART